MRDWVKEAVAESCIQVTEAMHKVLLCTSRHACLVAIAGLGLWTRERFRFCSRQRPQPTTATPSTQFKTLRQLSKPRSSPAQTKASGDASRQVHRMPF